MYDIVIQIIGLIGAIISILVFQKNERDKLLYLQATGSIFLTIHFFLLFAYTASILSLIGAIKSIIFAKFRKSKPWLFFFISLYVISGAVTYQESISLLPIFAMIISTIGFWSSDTKNIRKILLLSPPAWFIYSFYVNSYPAMLLESFVFISLIIGIYRFDYKKSNQMSTHK